MVELRVAVSHRFNTYPLYVNTDGTVYYKHVGGKRYGSLDEFKEQYKAHFKTYPRIIPT